MKKAIMGLAFLVSVGLGGSGLAAPKYEADVRGGVGVGDVTQDGRPDVVYLVKSYGKDKDFSVRRLAVKVNLGTGQYLDHLLDDGYTILGCDEREGMDIEIADMDKDGLQDIVVKDCEKIILYMNKGNLRFDKKVI